MNQKEAEAWKAEALASRERIKVLEKGIDESLATEEQTGELFEQVMDSLEHQMTTVAHIRKLVNGTVSDTDKRVLIFTMVNEDGEEYDAFTDFGRAQEMLDRFPNDSIVVTYAKEEGA